ncbi:MAG: methyltransferase domain-containing protein [Polyangiaceae bacterium]
MTTSFDHDNPRLAAIYDRLSESQFQSGKRLVERLELRSGNRVLDIGCGTGRLAEWIAEIVGPDGNVVGIDPLPERVAIARARARRASFEIGRAEDLCAFAAGSFDAVCMSAVFHWVSDKPKALAEVKRVLRSGGRLGVTTLPKELIGASTVTEVCAPVFSRHPYSERVDLSALALVSRGHTTTELISMVLASGLELVELSIRQRTRAIPNGEAVVDFVESSSFGNFLRIVPEELRAPLKADLANAFEARRGPEGIAVRNHGTTFVARLSPKD